VTVDTSIAAVTVIDQSGSMHDKLEGAAKIALALGEALETIGAKSAITGFTTNGRSAIYNGGDCTAAWAEFRAMGAHRSDGIDIDVFKGFDERWRSAAPRLAKLRASGGTPMSDGVEHALKLLSTRREGYRVIFVLTDGVPDGGHAEVLKGQFRRAAEAGVMIVGVGLGRDSHYVTTTFEHSVYAEKLADIPRPLVAKLHELVVGGAGRGRGRKVRAA
jgi:nitric oxide reductase activation protein